VKNEVCPLPMIPFITVAVKCRDSSGFKTIKNLLRGTWVVKKYDGRLENIRGSFVPELSNMDYRSRKYVVQVMKYSQYIYIYIYILLCANSSAFLEERRFGINTD
jgi:hypothetical protein